MSMLKLFSFNNQQSSHHNHSDNDQLKDWENIQSDFFIKAMAYGIIGKEFILIQKQRDYKSLIERYEKILLDKDNEKIGTEINNIKLREDNINKSLREIQEEMKSRIKTSTEYKYKLDDDKMLLFSEMLKYIPSSVHDMIFELNKDSKLGDDTLCDLYTIAHEYKYLKLWEDYEKAQRSVLYEIDYKRYAQRFTVFDGVLALLSNEYIKEAWAANEDDGDLANDIVTVNANLALLGALIVTLAFPLYTSSTLTEQWYDGDINVIIYLYGVIACGTFESTSLLIAIRNIIGVNLIETHNLKAFVKSSTKLLLLPITLNMLGVLSLLIALLCFGFSVLGSNFFLFFIVLLALPALFLIFYASGAIIKNIFKNQPWYHKKNLKIWSDLNEEEREGEINKINLTKSLSKQTIAVGVWEKKLKFCALGSNKVNDEKTQDFQVVLPKN